MQLSISSPRRSLRHVAWTGAFALIASMPIMPARAAPAPGLPDLLQTLLPSVVNITTRSLVPILSDATNAAGSASISSGKSLEQRGKTALGSGFIIDPDGLIVTNNHVIEGAFDVSVTFMDGTIAHAAIVATTKISDIALLKVDLGHKLPALRFGDSAALRVGDTVIAIGNPLGFGGSVSTGIVSALNRDIMLSPLDDFIQTDASLNHGNSGGPLLNATGEVVGVNTALINPTAEGGSIGIGFAIPAFDVQFVIGQLRRFGVVRAGDLGLKVQDVTTEIAHATGMPVAAWTAGFRTGSAGWGVIVTNVTEGGPAAEAGLQEGDIVFRMDDVAIGDMRMLARMIAVHPLNERAILSVWRDGMMASVTPIVREWLGGEQTDRAAFARSTALRQNTMDLGLRLGLPIDRKGVLVVGVMPDSIAGDRGLREGDVILKLMNLPVSQPEDLLRALRSMFETHHTMAMLLVRTAEGLRWVPLPLSGPT